MFWRLWKSEKGMIRHAHNKIVGVLFGAAALVVGWTGTQTAHAAVLNVDVAGITTNGEFGDPTNTVLNFNIGTGTHVTGIGYDVNLTAFDPSYLSEITVSFTPSDPNSPAGVFLTPAFDQPEPGTGDFSSGGIVDLVGLGLDFNVASDGVLRLEFFEGFQDAGVDPNGIFNSGTLNVQYDAAVPEPSTWALSIVGVTIGGLVLRRRQAAPAL